MDAPKIDARKAFDKPTPPERFCNLDRVLYALEARGLDGIVATTPQNVYYLAGFNGIGHKADEPRVYAVILSRHAPDHPIFVVVDYYLGTFMTQPSWIEDVRPFRGAMQSLDLPQRADDIDRFIPQSEVTQESLNSARQHYDVNIGSVVKKALADLKLDNRRVAFDDPGFGMRLGINAAEVADGYSPMMFARAIKTPYELDLLRRATRLNEMAIRRTCASWDKGVTWRDLNIIYAVACAELGGFVRDPGGMVWGQARGTESTIMLSNGYENAEVGAGTHVMFDCHGTIDLYCWDGGKTWVAGGEPEGEGKRWAAATSAVAELLAGAMKPGARISDLQTLARRTYAKAGVPDPDSAVIFFHGLGMSHMEAELTTASGQVQTTDFVLEEGMVVPIHLLYPGSQFDRSWCEDVFEITGDGGKPMFSWGFDPLAGNGA